jgi:gluconate 5-dehydrogenase
MSLAKLQDLKGRVAPVTGGSRGLGLQIAEVLGELGAKVAITARNPEGVPTLAYKASKGGVVNITRTLANEWAPFGINAKAIAPGYFPTKMTAQLDKDAAAEMAPMKRCGGAEDLKGIAALFASDICALITGQTLAADW